MLRVQPLVRVSRLFARSATAGMAIRPTISPIMLRPGSILNHQQPRLHSLNQTLYRAFHSTRASLNDSSKPPATATERQSPDPKNEIKLPMYDMPMFKQIRHLRMVFLVNVFCSTALSLWVRTDDIYTVLAAGAIMAAGFIPLAFVQLMYYDHVKSIRILGALTRKQLNMKKALGPDSQIEFPVVSETPLLITRYSLSGSDPSTPVYARDLVPGTERKRSVQWLIRDTNIGFHDAPSFLPDTLCFIFPPSYIKAASDGKPQQSAMASKAYKLRVVSCVYQNYWEGQVVNGKNKVVQGYVTYIRLCGNGGVSAIVPCKWGPGADETIELHHHFRELLGYKLDDTITVERFEHSKEAEVITLAPIDSTAIYPPSKGKAAVSVSPLEAKVRYEPVGIPTTELKEGLKEFFQTYRDTVVVKGDVLSCAINEKYVDFIVMYTSEDGPCRIKDPDCIHVSSPLMRRELLPRFALIGGYKEKLGIQQARGIILHGPAGHRKASEVGMRFLCISGPEMNLRKKFDEAASQTPALLFIDQLDAIAAKRDPNNREASKYTLVSQLLVLMDQLLPDVTVVAATNYIHEIDHSLRSSGRFSHEIEIGIPTEEERKDILTKILDGMSLDPGTRPTIIDEVAKKTHGYVGADLQLLCTEAGRHRLHTEREHSANQTASVSSPRLYIAYEDFEHARKVVKPSLLREMAFTIPAECFDDIGGMDSTITELKSIIEDLVDHKPTFDTYRMPLPRGMLLYGPPGCGKTILAKATANAGRTHFLQIRGPELIDKYVGESEARVRRIFARARSVAPCIIFFDEIDALTKKRTGVNEGCATLDGVLTQLLTELDGMIDCKGVFALLRPGRLEKLVHIKMPREDSRAAILRRLLCKFDPHQLKVDIEKIAKHSSGYSGADLRELCRNAFRHAIRAVNPGRDGTMADVTLSPEDFIRAFGESGPSVSKQTIQEYETFEIRNGRRQRIPSIYEISSSPSILPDADSSQIQAKEQEQL
ncbi:AAA-domain-containing protein [Linderina pennispora]|uniref:AAA-domain-containing protein n=1 Tax=Linderina pennispora TaxID=61395 RepID=A0A1Y1WGB3_9FUNG|nr:AAA-domain-containing protein [Linderina pennispora]ORX72435.1 AAA-domain-containing protein [Linderina pennispora]